MRLLYKILIEYGPYHNFILGGKKGEAYYDVDDDVLFFFFICRVLLKVCLKITDDVGGTWCSSTINIHTSVEGQPKKCNHTNIFIIIIIITHQKQKKK